jgi:hypothetical protein
MIVSNLGRDRAKILWQGGTSLLAATISASIFRPEPIDNGRRGNKFTGNRHNHNLGKRRLTYNFFLKDRCALPDQISSSLTSSRRAFILAMRYRDRSN